MTAKKSSKEPSEKRLLKIIAELENRVSRLEAEAKENKARANYAGACADGALYVANYCNRS